MATLEEVLTALNNATTDAREVLTKIPQIATTNGDVPFTFADGTQITLPGLPKLKSQVDNFIAGAREEYNVLLDYPHIYVDPINGDDSNSGSKNSPIKTLEEAYKRCPVGKHTRILIRGSGDPSNPVVLKMPYNYIGGFTYVTGVTPDWSSFSDGSDIVITDDNDVNRRLGFIWGRHLLYGVTIERNANSWYKTLKVYGSVVYLYKCKVINKSSQNDVIVVGADSGGGFLRLKNVEIVNESGNVGISMVAPSMCYGVSVSFAGNITVPVQKEDTNLCVTNL